MLDLGRCLFWAHFPLDVAIFKAQQKVQRDSGLDMWGVNSLCWGMETLAPIHSNRSSAFVLTSHQPPLSSKSSKRGHLLVFLKNHSIYLTSQKPDTWRDATQYPGRACVLYFHTRLLHMFKVFSGIFHHFENEIKILRVATFKQRAWNILLSLFFSLYPHTFRWWDKWLRFAPGCFLSDLKASSLPFY